MAKTLADFVREARAQIEEWDAETAHANLAQGSLLVVDVREPHEYDHGHIPGAINVPRGTLEGAADPGYKHRVEQLCHAHGQPILLYCQSGGRSAMAGVTLKQMGFEKVYNLAGGMHVWEAEGLPVAKGAAP